MICRVDRSCAFAYHATKRPPHFPLRVDAATEHVPKPSKSFRVPMPSLQHTVSWPVVWRRLHPEP